MLRIKVYPIALIARFEYNFSDLQVASKKIFQKKRFCSGTIDFSYVVAK